MPSPEAVGLPALQSAREAPETRRATRSSSGPVVPVAAPPTSLAPPPSPTLTPVERPSVPTGHHRHRRYVEVHRHRREGGRDAAGGAERRGRRHAALREGRRYHRRPVRILAIGVESVEMAYADGRGRQTIRSRTVGDSEHGTGKGADRRGGMVSRLAWRSIGVVVIAALVAGAPPGGRSRARQQAARAGDWDAAVGFYGRRCRTTRIAPTTRSPSNGRCWRRRRCIARARAFDERTSARRPCAPTARRFEFEPSDAPVAQRAAELRAPAARRTGRRSPTGDRQAARGGPPPVGRADAQSASRDPLSIASPTPTSATC